MVGARRRPVRLAAAALAAGLFLALAVPPAHADTIEFKNGRTLEGTVVDETDLDITLRFEGGQVTFEKNLVSAVRRDGPGVRSSSDAGSGDGPAPAPPVARPSPFVTGVSPASEDWALLWSADRRVGWRHTQYRSDATGHLFEDEVLFLGEDGKVELDTRLVEEAGPALEPRSFLYRETAGPRAFTRSGRAENGRLYVETFDEGKRLTSDHPLPPGFRLALAARAFVLKEGGRLPGGWKGTTYDPRTGEFVTLSLAVVGDGTVTWEGRPEEVLILRREQAGVRGEERITATGSVLTADLNGTALSSVRTTRDRIDILREGREVPVSGEERKARKVFTSPEDGFRIFKPSIAWEFVPPESRDAGVRVTVRDTNGLVFFQVSSEPLTGEPPPLPELGARLEKLYRSRAAEFDKLEDGYRDVAGLRAYSLLGDAVLKGDKVRLFAATTSRGGRTWTFAAVCPRSGWKEAWPHLEAILDGFEWL